MGFGSNRVQRVATRGFAYKLRRRFSKLLIVFGLVYIGMAISTVTHLPQQTQSTQQFTTTKPASSELASNKQPAPGTVLSASTPTQNYSSAPSQVFIPQCTYRTIPYKTVYKTAAWLNVGQTMTTGGLDGEEKICSNQYGPPTVTTIISPLDKTITTGTYQPTNYYPGYINTDGDYVPSPNYSGGVVGGYSPTAVCGDGTYSYSQNSSGTCSSHGGVTSWL